MPSDSQKSKEQLISEPYFRDLIDGSIVMVQGIDLDGRILFVNRKWRETLGYEEADIETLSFFDILHPDYLAHCKELFALVAAGEQDRAYHLETILLSKDCREVMVEGDCGPLRPGDKIAGVLGLFQDITRRKRAEEALRDSERRLELALESAGLGLWNHNFKSGEVIRDKRWAEMLGYTLAELKSSTQTWKELIHPDDLDMVNKIAKDHEEGRIPFFKVEHRLRTRTGEWKWILNWGKVVERDEEGRPIRAAGTHLDISELKRKEEERLKLEAMIQQAQKFESLNVMAGSIAHNFNNLLMVVLGNLELAAHNLADTLLLKRYIENAEKAAKHAAELSGLMLTYVGQTKVNIQTINLSGLIEEMMAVLELVLSKKAALHFKPASGPVNFKGDHAHIRQVVMNLVTNAAEALGDKEGTITLSTGTVFCDPTTFRQPLVGEGLKAGDYAYLDVTDTGCGMDEETQARVFDPFFTNKFPGRGLGMAVVLGILRAHHGAISLKSQAGKGTTVRILFASQGTSLTGQAQERGVPTGWRGKGNILLVEDEEPVLGVAREMLARLGFNVLTAGSGQEALEMYRKKADNIRCVLLDLTMPRMDGVETFHELRRIRGDVHVIISSGYSEDKVRGFFTDTLPAGFIQKPYQLASLAARIRQVLEG